jgi:hypothetical protein
MTRVLSTTLAPYDINVNCICPGGVATDMLREVAVAYGKLAGQAPEDVFPQLVSTQLLRHIEPVEVARTISFLLSEDAVIIRGQAISADGGDTPYWQRLRRWAAAETRPEGCVASSSRFRSCLAVPNLSAQQQGESHETHRSARLSLHRALRRRKPR